MACCKACCGCADCAEGDQGKCCCGGSGGECCLEGEYCCDGVCQGEPCEDECETDEDCCFLSFIPDTGTHGAVTAPPAGYSIYVFDDGVSSIVYKKADCLSEPERVTAEHTSGPQEYDAGIIETDCCDGECCTPGNICCVNQAGVQGCWPFPDLCKDNRCSTCVEFGGTETKVGPYPTFFEASVAGQAVCDNDCDDLCNVSGAFQCEDGAYVLVCCTPEVP